RGARGGAAAALALVARVRRRRPLQAAHATLHRAQLEDLRLLRGGAELLELARRDEHAAFERRNRRVVAVARAIEALAHARHVVGHRREAAVQFLAELADLARVLRDAFLAPAVGG